MIFTSVCFSYPLSLRERVRVRGRSISERVVLQHALTPALSRRERE
jgi:hypothetical protein